ncbi:MAG: GNAT family N-acetyltransferase [Desulfosarcinaceae bacterium]|nr:GNAT family N-acetyltransferase [Desulfosarcinaceae bacterium]
MKIDITKATKEEKAIIQNLARFYIYDLSEFQGRKCPDDGLYADEDYIRYWTKAGHFPYLVKCQNELAGFVFVKQGGSSPNIAYHIAEFFIVRKFRHQGVASIVAKEIVMKYPGEWEIMVISNNLPAIHFWENFISGFTKGIFTKTSEFHETDMIVFRFSNNTSSAKYRSLTKGSRGG